MTRIYQTKNIERAATIMTVTGYDPLVSFDVSGLAIFGFPFLPEVLDVIYLYDTGIQADAQKLLNNRNQLFKRIRGGRNGRAV